MRQTIEVPSVRDKDLLPILDRFGLSEAIQRSEVLCHSCQRAVGTDNVGALIVRGASLLISCELSECIEALAEADNEGEARTDP